MKTRSDRIGEINKNTYGTPMKIVEYNGAKGLIVEFEDGYTRSCTYKDFAKGNVKNPLDKSIFGIGYIGDGKYKTRINKENTKSYVRWISMMSRCYSKQYKDKKITYKNCTVYDGWHNYQNFAEWYDENYYDIENEIMHLDKDILVKDNKIYSPETCVFVPCCINIAFSFIKTTHDTDLPIGVVRFRNKFKASVGVDGKTIHIGIYKTLDEARIAYNTEKNIQINNLGMKYKNIIPENLFGVLVNFRMEERNGEIK